MKKKVLIIDDNPENYEDFVSPLKRKYDVIITLSLRDAFRKVKLYNFDLIIIDIMMPTRDLKNKDELMTGLCFYKEQLRPLEHEKQLRILFWSNLTQRTYDEFFGEDKPDNVDFTHKETRNKNHLLEKVNELIG